MNYRITRRCFKISTAFVFCHILLWFSESDDDSDLFTLLKANNSLVNSASNQVIFVDRTFAQPSESSEGNKLVIGTNFCKNGNSIKKNKYYEQTIVMLKSVLISANMYNIATVEIHLFLDHVKEDEKYFREEIEQKMVFPGKREHQKPKVKLKVYSADLAIPKKYRSYMINHERFRCTFVPFFYQKSLPDVDSIIHLDSETIITGNIGRLWDQLGLMSSRQMVSMGYHRQPENDKYKNLDSVEFRDVPHYISKRINSNVAVMNLTKMRTFEYLEKTLEYFDKFSKKLNKLNSQHLANIMLKYNREILLILPCHMNFLATDCQRGFFCKFAFEDAEGLQLINGNSLRFMENQVFHPFYKYYSLFNVSDPNASYQTDLMKPIQRAFSNTTNRANNQCYGNVNKVVFKGKNSWFDSFFL